MHVRAWAGLAIFAFGAFAQAPLETDNGPKVATIHIRPTDKSGEPIQAATAILKRIDSSTEIHPSSGTEFLGVPYGDYRLSVGANFFFSRDDVIVAVDRREIWRTVTLSIAGIDGVPPCRAVVSGQLKGMPKVTGRLWAKLVGVVDDVSVEADVSERGFFLFEPHFTGAYILMIINDAKVLHTEQLDVKACNMTFIVDLAKKE
jgi:hypothetical protein